MSHRITIEEAASRLADLISTLAPGEEITLLSHDRPVAKIIPESQSRRQPGAWRGMISENPEVPEDAHLEDFKEYMQ